MKINCATPPLPSGFSSVNEVRLNSPGRARNPASQFNKRQLIPSETRTTVKVVLQLVLQLPGIRTVRYWFGDSQSHSPVILGSPGSGEPAAGGCWSQTGRRGWHFVSSFAACWAVEAPWQRFLQLQHLPKDRELSPAPGKKNTPQSLGDVTQGWDEGITPRCDSIREEPGLGN